MLICVSFHENIKLTNAVMLVLNSITSLGSLTEIKKKTKKFNPFAHNWEN